MTFKSQISKDFDQKYMLLALELAAKAQGHVSPNPMVGCVIVKNQKIIAKGYHKKFGGPHAEVEALKKLRLSQTKGATVYVTLEPCHHHGKTPPCVDALIKAQVYRVVIAMRDPNPLTCGQSIQKLKQQGIVVQVGVCAQQALALNRGFVKVMQKGFPYVIVKVAQSADEKIAERVGVRTQITGSVANRYVQNLRKSADAILVGRQTVEVDDPVLTVRDSKFPQPYRVILDSQLQTSLKKRIFKHKGGPVVICAAKSVDVTRLQKFANQNIQVLLCDTQKNGHLQWQSVLKELLHRCGINTVLIEGGSAVLNSLAKTKFVDEWQLITSPMMLGKHGVGLPSQRPKNLMQKPIQSQLGRDVLKVYRSKVKKG